MPMCAMQIRTYQYKGKKIFEVAHCEEKTPACRHKPDLKLEKTLDSQPTKSSGLRNSITSLLTLK